MLPAAQSFQGALSSTNVGKGYLSIGVTSQALPRRSLKAERWCRRDGV